MVLFPVLTMMIFLISPVIALIPKYGKWELALPSFYFLCFGAGISALSNILVNALDATGKVKTTLRSYGYVDSFNLGLNYFPGNKVWIYGHIYGIIF